MAGYKIDRITSDIRIAMADILRDIKDPRVSKMLSIIKVQVTNDLSYATFYGQNAKHFQNYIFCRNKR